MPPLMVHPPRQSRVFQTDRFLERRVAQDECARLDSAQHKEQWNRIVAKIFQTGEPVEYKTDYRRKDGSQVPVSIAMFVVKGDDGKPAGLAAIVHVLTERK